MAQLAVLAALALLSACDAPASAAITTGKHVPWFLRAGETYRFRINVEIVRLPRVDDGPPERFDVRAMTARTVERVQIDDVVTIDAVDSRGASITETFEQVFTDVTRCQFGDLLSSLSITTQLGPGGHLVGREVRGSQRSTYGSLPQIDSPGLDLGYLPPLFVRAGDSWPRVLEVSEPRCTWGECTYRKSTSYTLHATSPCPERGRCLQVSAVDQEEDSFWWRRHSWYDITVDPRDLQLLRIEGRSNAVELMEEVSSIWSITLISEPSKQPLWKPVRKGVLRVWSKPWTMVSIDGWHPSPWSQTPLCVNVPVGRHSVRIANDDLPYAETVELGIAEDATVEIGRDLCSTFPSYGVCTWR
ncbi:MAG: hypothetical protein KF773_17405 [Deltaproteobacteria bacterium]|nr:hypothetical protein [Deltaproteobacteria bacterium]